MMNFPNRNFMAVRASTIKQHYALTTIQMLVNQQEFIDVGTDPRKQTSSTKTRLF